MSVRILIVDDQPSVRNSLRSLLASRPDWEISGEAADGLEGIEKAKALRPDVVLMDISMPRLNGLDAARILRSEVPESKVVIVSQNDPAVVSRQASEVNAAAHVAKQEIFATLLPVLDGLLSLADPDAAPVPVAPELDSPLPEWLTGSGRLGELIGRHDWSRTPLGPISGWPQSLKTSVNLILDSQHPMWIGWGREITFLYNQAYVQVLGHAKHPWALGRPAAEVWSEIWDICGPLSDKVFQHGEASFVDEVRLFMNRGDFFEETYYSFSYSPIRDESGRVSGLFCPSTEVTAKVINARRLHTLSELSANALVEKTTGAACASVIDTLANNLDDVPFAILYLTDGDNQRLRLEQLTGIDPQFADLAPPLVDSAAGVQQVSVWPLADVVRTGQSQVVPVAQVEGLPTGLADLRLSQAIVLPILARAEEPTLGVLIAGVNPTRRLDPDYLTFYSLLVNQVASAIQNARSAEEERKRLEALAELDRAKTAFFSNVSHEFRTPLTLMLGPVEELLSKSATDLSPSAKSQLELVNRNGIRLLRLVNTLLDFSRIEAGRMQAIYQPTDLAAFTAELASVFASAIGKAGLRLDVDCPPLLEPVYVDRSMWEKIVLNLVSNAFKFTFDGEISVSLHQVNDAVQLRVRDTGVGISEPELSRVFERFHRVDNTRSRTHEGSGIGLALVQELVKLHSGCISVESAVGEGTTFLVSLPLGKAHLSAERIGLARTLRSAAVGAAPFVEEALRWLPDSALSDSYDELPVGHELMSMPADGPVVDAQNRPFILLADDNADMRQYLFRILAERYEVQCVPDGEAALAAIRKRLPELVLTDVMMPRLDGFGLLRELRSDSRTRTLPVIVLSARAGEESCIEGMEQGADDYLIKPFSARELLVRVQTHLGMARIRVRSEEDLKLAQENYRTLADNMSQFAWMSDNTGWISWYNQRWFDYTGGTLNDMQGWGWRNVLHPDHVDKVIDKFKRCITAGVIWEDTFPLRSNDGEYRWFLSRAVPIKDSAGQITRWFGTNTDITELRHAQDALRESKEFTEAQVRVRTHQLELRTAEVIKQSEQLSELSQRMLQIQEDERRHVARELHDSAGQTLTALGMSLGHLAQLAREGDPQLISHLEETQQFVRQLSQEIRTMSYLLHPPLLDESGLPVALRWYVQGLAERSGLSINVDIPEDLGRFPHEMELMIFRLVQECLTNIHRHSGSKTAEIRIWRAANNVILEVQDEGKGIPANRLAEIQAHGAGVGIRGMRERIRRFEGQMEISSDESGTTVSFKFPVPKSSSSPVRNSSGVQIPA